jgi:hypothetical protein
MHPEGALDGFEMGIDGFGLLRISFHSLGFGISEGRGYFPVGADLGSFAVDGNADGERGLAIFLAIFDLPDENREGVLRAHTIQIFC